MLPAKPSSTPVVSLGLPRPQPATALHRRVESIQPLELRAPAATAATSSSGFGRLHGSAWAPMLPSSMAVQRVQLVGAKRERPDDEEQQQQEQVEAPAAGAAAATPFGFGTPGAGRLGSAFPGEPGAVVHGLRSVQPKSGTNIFSRRVRKRMDGLGANALPAEPRPSMVTAAATATAAAAPMMPTETAQRILRAIDSVNRGDEMATPR